jgi:hypothetical protein
MSFSRTATVAILVAGLGLCGCGSTKRALGMGKATPDEFRIVTKAPLVVPPDYSLRPPAPGQPRPAELQPDSAARVAMLNQVSGEQRSQGEQLLVGKAGAAQADPLARYVVDDEFGNIAHKDKTYADQVMFGGAQTPADATAVKAATGGQQVVIQQRKSTRSKLPGL